MQRLTPSDIEKIKQDRLFVHLRGIIRYADVFGDEHATRFNQVWEYSDSITISDGTRWGFWRNCGAPEENSET
jgi:hypothetical protein